MTRWKAAAVALVLAFFCLPFVVASEVKLQPGKSFRLVRTAYLMAVFDSMADKREGKGPAQAFLHPERYAKTRWVAFQCQVPAGTVITIVGPAPPARDLWRTYDSYYVRMRPDPSRQLDVILSLFLGFADASGGPSSMFFEPLDQPSGRAPEGAGDCIELK